MELPYQDGPLELHELLIRERNAVLRPTEHKRIHNFLKLNVRVSAYMHFSVAKVHRVLEIFKFHPSNLHVRIKAGEEN